MSVYTRVEPAQLQALLSDYAVGELKNYAGISAGITNTNYFVDTTLGRWVLTIFERLEASELSFFMELMDHLAAHGVPSAHPVARSDGRFLSTVAGKPAALVYRLRGASVDCPDIQQCANLGAVVAEQHRAAASFQQQRANSRGLGWVKRTRERIAGKISAQELTLLDDELAFQTRQDLTQLPRGVIHADLFRDNVLMEEDQVTGLIDFYYACSNVLLFDLAVICNDWCIDDAHSFMPQHWQAVSRAYARRRPYTEDEQAAWPAILRAAALRFWVSRMHDWHFPRDGEDTHQKDPAPFMHILQAHRDTPPLLLP